MTIELDPRSVDLPQGDQLTRTLEAIAVALSHRSGGATPASGGVSPATSRTVPVTNAPTPLASANQSRRQITLQNQGGSPVTLGHAQGVQFGQGIQLNAGATASDDAASVFTGEWWAVANVAGPINIGIDDQG